MTRTKEDRRPPQADQSVEREHNLFDPFERHFVSQNRQNEFLKALEDRSSSEEF